MYTPIIMLWCYLHIYPSFMVYVCVVSKEIICFIEEEQLILTFYSFVHVHRKRHCIPTFFSQDKLLTIQFIVRTSLKLLGQLEPILAKITNVYRLYTHQTKNSNKKTKYRYESTFSYWHLKSPWPSGLYIKKCMH